jgi:hypothetical protein
MNERLQEIRARLHAWGYMTYKGQAEHAAEYAGDFAADAEWLLDRVQEQEEHLRAISADLSDAIRGQSSPRIRRDVRQ